MTFDVEAERFDITYGANQTSPEAISTVIRNLGYEPSIVAAAPKRSARRTHVPVAELPEEFRDLFAEARRVGRTVLLDFTAPG